MTCELKTMVCRQSLLTSPLARSSEVMVLNSARPSVRARLARRGYLTPLSTDFVDMEIQ